MKKIVIDGVIYRIKNMDFKKLESLVASMQIAPIDEELEYYRKYIKVWRWYTCRWSLFY